MNERSGKARALALALCLALLTALSGPAEATVYLIPGLHNHNERYGVVAREQPSSGESGALREIKRSKVDVVRMPVSKVLAQVQAEQSKTSGESTSRNPRTSGCSSLEGPFCFQSFVEGLSVSQFRPKFPQQGVHEVSEESLQLTILSSPGDVLILLYTMARGGAPEAAEAAALDLRTSFVKAGTYLKGQIDVAAIDCTNHSGVSSYCQEVRDSPHGRPMLKHFRRLSDNVYTIHSKEIVSKDDVSIHATIEFLRGSHLQRTGSEAEEDPRKKLLHSNKRMLVVRNRSSYVVTVSWAMEEAEGGVERLYYELVPGASQLVNVFVSQKWTVREKISKALIKEISVKQDMSLGGVALHVISTEMVQKGIMLHAD